MNYRISTFGLALLIVSLNFGTAHAQNNALNWAEKMFSDLKVDFGTVARGADTRYQLVIENLYEENVELVDVGTTCGCTAAKPDKTLLKTHEKANIEIVMDTKKFMHRKDSNVDVTLRFHGDQGAATKTVRVPITAYIRSDVVLTPGNSDFGTVEFGQPAEKVIKVAYAGRNDWSINGIRNGNEFLNAEVQEVARANGRVTYELTVRLTETAKIGPFQNKIFLLTDDSKSPEVPVLVTGRVAPDIEIVPNNVPLGLLAPGEVKQFNIVVKGKRPFAITNIECDTHPDCFEIRPLTEDSKTVHVIPFRLTAPDAAGKFAETFAVTIAGRKEPISFSADGKIREAN